MEPSAPAGIKVTVDSLKLKASEKTGLTDFGADNYSAALAAWVDDINGPIPNDRGRKFFAGLAVNDLARRLQVMECFKQHPEIDDVVIPPIFYITGHERSGTTLLHNLLSLDESARSLKRWELMRPTPPPEAATYLTDPRIAQVQAPQEKLRGTLLEHMHWVDSSDPEECTWGLLNCTSFLGQSPACVLPKWDNWLATVDMTETFVEYRRLIKLLLWRNPLGKSGYLVLKAPQHAGLVDVIARIFPEAHFVFTHRDPYRVFTSVCALVAHTNESFIENKADLNPGNRVINKMVDRCEKKLTAMIAHEETLSTRVTSVSYPDLIDNPYDAIRSIYERAERPSPPQLEQLISDYLEQQRAGRRAKPPSRMPNFGFDHEQFLQRPKIEDYCRHFEVRPELARTTG